MDARPALGYPPSSHAFLDWCTDKHLARGRGGGGAGPQGRAFLPLAVVDGGATQLHPQAAGAGSHYRSGVGAVPGRRLGLPAGQGGGPVAEQGVGQGRKPGGQPVEQVVETGGKAAVEVVALGAVTPHRIQRIGQPEELTLRYPMAKDCIREFCPPLNDAQREACRRCGDDE